MTSLLLLKREVDKFHNHINDIEASIIFTIEHEINNSIPYFDVCVTQKASGRLMTKFIKTQRTLTDI